MPAEHRDALVVAGGVYQLTCPFALAGEEPLEGVGVRDWEKRLQQFVADPAAGLLGGVAIQHLRAVVPVDDGATSSHRKMASCVRSSMRACRASCASACRRSVMSMVAPT